MIAPCADLVVLIVEEADAFRHGVAANLRDDGHVVHQCATPTDVATEQLDAAHVVVTHFHMSEMDGIAFADDLQRRRAGLAVLLVTAYWTVEVETAAAVRPHVHLCRRPIDYHELHQRIHDVARAA
jgi:two-component system response regulator FlrC